MPINTPRVTSVMMRLTSNARGATASHLNAASIPPLATSMPMNEK
jgi:hypothetical protein